MRNIIRLPIIAMSLFSVAAAAQTDCELGDRYYALAQKARSEYRSPDAYDWLKRAMETCPNYRNVQEFGETAMAMGEAEQLQLADDAFVQALELGDTPEQKARAAGKYAELVFLAGDPQRAEKPALYALELDGDERWIQELVENIAYRKRNPLEEDIVRGLSSALYTPMNIQVAVATSAKTVRVDDQPESPSPIFDLPINFKLDSVALAGGSSKNLETVVKAISRAEFQGQKFMFIGHADVRGSSDYNMQLSERRAAAMSEWATKRNPSLEGRIVPVGKGEAEPVDFGESEAAHSRNRRLEIRVLKEGSRG